MPLSLTITRSCHLSFTITPWFILSVICHNSNNVILFTIGFTFCSSLLSLPECATLFTMGPLWSITIIHRGLIYCDGNLSCSFYHNSPKLHSLLPCMILRSGFYHSSQNDAPPYIKCVSYLPEFPNSSSYLPSLLNCATRTIILRSHKKLDIYIWPCLIKRSIMHFCLFDWQIMNTTTLTYHNVQVPLEFPKFPNLDATKLHIWDYDYPYA